MKLWERLVYSLLGSAPDDERVILSKHVEQQKDGGIKIIYKNCASRWSSAHCQGVLAVTTELVYRLWKWIGSTY